MVREPFKHTFVGILLLGVASSLIAAYIWSRWNGAEAPAVGNGAVGQGNPTSSQGQGNAPKPEAAAQIPLSRQQEAQPPSPDPNSLPELTPSSAEDREELTSLCVIKDIPNAAAAINAGVFRVSMKGCAHKNNEITLAGIVEDVSDAKKLAVFHRFKVIDSEGALHQVERGSFGTSSSFGTGYSWQWLEPGIPVAFSFTVGSLNGPDTSLSVIMPSNQMDENGHYLDVTFKNLQLQLVSQQGASPQSQ